METLRCLPGAVGNDILLLRVGSWDLEAELSDATRLIEGRGVEEGLMTPSLGVVDVVGGPVFALMTRKESPAALWAFDLSAVFKTVNVLFINGEGPCTPSGSA